MDNFDLALGKWQIKVILLVSQL